MHKLTKCQVEEENKFHITIHASCVITLSDIESVLTVTVKSNLHPESNEQVHKVSGGREKPV